MFIFHNKAVKDKCVRNAHIVPSLFKNHYIHFIDQCRKKYWFFKSKLYKKEFLISKNVFKCTK